MRGGDGRDGEVLAGRLAVLPLGRGLRDRPLSSRGRGGIHRGPRQEREPLSRLKYVIYGMTFIHMHTS